MDTTHTRVDARHTHNTQSFRTGPATGRSEMRMPGAGRRRGDPLSTFHTPHSKTYIQALYIARYRKDTETTGVSPEGGCRGIQLYSNVEALQLYSSTASTLYSALQLPPQKSELYAAGARCGAGVRDVPAGHDGRQSLQSMERFNPKAGAWEATLPSKPLPRTASGPDRQSPDRCEYIRSEWLAD